MILYMSPHQVHLIDSSKIKYRERKEKNKQQSSSQRSYTPKKEVVAVGLWVERSLKRTFLNKDQT